jgi:hypothetical protein
LLQVEVGSQQGRCNKKEQKQTNILFHCRFFSLIPREPVRFVPEHLCQRGLP